MAKKRKAKSRKSAVHCKRVQRQVKSNQQEITNSRLDEVGPSHHSRETCLDGTNPCMPKHKIFLSHSGAQKDFTEHLWKELKRVNHDPFFDRDTCSLRNGEMFYPPLKLAAENCRVAILVLSTEFFTSSKWPMMELNWFVKAQKSDERLKILPLFLDISREAIEEQKTKWLKIWSAMNKKDPRIVVEEWQYALTQIPSSNGLRYTGNIEGHASFIEKVVEAVCMLLPPDMKWDMSDVRSKKQLSEPILQRLAEVKPSDKYKVRVMGLHGVGGIGKTTISRVVYNQKFVEFRGKVCYIEFGDKSLVELQKIVLRELTEWREVKDRPVDQHDKLSELLKQRMHQQKVFLILDNIWDSQMDEVKMYFNAGYHCDSMILVTSRSRKILEQLGIRNCDSMEMPELGEMGAIDLFLHYAEIKPKEVCLEFVRTCVLECYFQKMQGVDSSYNTKSTFHYHPLALKVLGKYFGSLDSETMKWNEKLDRLMAHKTYLLEEKQHPIFCILGLGFDELGKKQQQIFLDLALVCKSKWFKDFFYWEHVRLDWDWLCRIHEQTNHVMKENVKAIQRKGLIDSVYEIEKLDFDIHDLYLEFAEFKSKEKPSQRRLLKVYGSKAEILETTKLEFCKRVEVLDLDECKNLQEVDVTEMDNLRCVVVTNCENLGRWTGLEKLRNLIIFHWNLSYSNSLAAIPTMFKFLNDLGSLTSLQVLKLENLRWIEDTFQLDLRRCTNLQELSLPCLINLPGKGRDETPSQNRFYVDFNKYLPKSVSKIDFSQCCMVWTRTSFNSMSSLTNLQDLNLNGCNEIKDLTSVCELISLRKLNVGNTGIQKLPDNFKDLKKLQVLDMSGCCYLTSIVGIGHATTLEVLNLIQCIKLTSIASIAHVKTLQRVIASICWILIALPHDFSSLPRLEMLDLHGNISICKLPRDYKRLAGQSGNALIVNLKGCWNLIGPLVEKLRCPHESHEWCIDLCNCRGMSMQSWIDARKNVDGAAYDLLKSVLSMKDASKGESPGEVDLLCRTLLLDDVQQLEDYMIRAFCEHDERSTYGIDTFVDVLCKSESRVLYGHHFLSMKWVIIATAPCTFKVMMKKASMEPWNRTLFHYTMTCILPQQFSKDIYYRFPKRLHISSEYDDGSELWLDAIKALLWKCKEKLEEAIQSDIQNIQHMRCNEGMRVVDIFLKEIQATRSGDEIEEDSILWSSADHDYYFRTYSSRPFRYYRDLFPNFPFEQIFQTEKVVFQSFQ